MLSDITKNVGQFNALENDNTNSVTKMKYTSDKEEIVASLKK